jgi:hypothetical protein
MNSTLRNILAFFGALIIGSFVNMGIILISSSIIPPPEGADMTTMKGLTEGMSHLEAKHFIMPFLAHALGTLVGAFAVAKLAVSHQMRFAFGIGLFFLVGGVANISILPLPLAFNIVDLVGAYIPMAYLGGKWATKA